MTKTLNDTIDTVLEHKSYDEALLTLIERKTHHKIISRIPSKIARELQMPFKKCSRDIQRIRTRLKALQQTTVRKFSELLDRIKNCQLTSILPAPMPRWNMGQMNAIAVSFEDASKRDNQSTRTRMSP